MEVLSPAGNMENLKACVASGADAVYLGLKNFSARSQAGNFGDEELRYAIAYAHTFGVKVYVAVNTLIKDSELEGFINAVGYALNAKADAFILQDVYLGDLLKSYFPDVVLHLSTQGGVINEYGALNAKKHGFSRVILARETSLKDIKKICGIIETEVFVHGALCTSFSGHCYFSSFIGGLSGNRGECKQPCRKAYSLEESGKVDRKGYLISLSDLCLDKQIETLKSLGVSSIKIEGRMRGAEYVSVATAYYKNLVNGVMRPDLFKALKKTFNRGDYTEGLAFGGDNIISDKIQSHKGLKVGIIGKICDDKIFFKDYYNFKDGDAFKIIRGEREAGNAIAKTVNGKLSLYFKGNAKVGDDINITKDSAIKDKFVLGGKLKDLKVKVTAKTGELLRMSANGITVESETPLTRAETAPATVDSIKQNLFKTDVYPFRIVDPEIEVSGEPFIVKSVLNNLRAKLYKTIFYGATVCEYAPVIYVETEIEKFAKKPIKCSIILNTTSVDALKSAGFSDVVYMPLSYNESSVLDDIKNVSGVNLWLYLPPNLSGEELQNIAALAKNFYGVYGECYWAEEFADKFNLKLMRGTGFNIFNKIDVKAALSRNERFVYSKELSLLEINAIGADGLILNDGAVELMDLCYCLFKKDCANCRRKNMFILKDEFSHEFQVIRYKTNMLKGGCKFKVFNSACVHISGFSFAVISDFRPFTAAIIESIIKSETEADLKHALKNTTRGNYVNGVK